MALTGLEIYKHLPKTNCKDCGFPTCLAFAMKMATKQVSLDKCPHVTAAGKAALESSARPANPTCDHRQRRCQIRIGNETQLYRHEEKFHRPAAVAVRISDTLDDGRLGTRRAIGKLAFERVGNRIARKLVAVDNESRRRRAVCQSGPAGGGEVRPGLHADVGSKADNLQRAAAASGGPAIAVVHFRSGPGLGCRPSRQDRTVARWPSAPTDWRPLPT